MEETIPYRPSVFKATANPEASVSPRGVSQASDLGTDFTDFWLKVGTKRPQPSPSVQKSSSISSPVPSKCSRVTSVNVKMQEILDRVISQGSITVTKVGDERSEPPPSPSSTSTVPVHPQDIWDAPTQPIMLISNNPVPQVLDTDVQLDVSHTEDYE